MPAQQIPAEPQRPDFDLYYNFSDERYHIHGGNDQIPHLLGEKLEKPESPFRRGRP